MRMNRDQIQQCIPHRPPFLWLDEVVSLNETEIHARKHLDPSLDVFAGHYPDFAVLPGVLQCEAAFQAAAVLIAHLKPPQADAVPVVTRLTNTQFRRIVRPGESLDINVTFTERLANAFYLRGKVTVDGQVAVRMEFVCAAANLSNQ